MVQFVTSIWKYDQSIQSQKICELNRVREISVEHEVKSQRKRRSREASSLEDEEREKATSLQGLKLCLYRAVVDSVGHYFRREIAWRAAVGESRVVDDLSRHQERWLDDSTRQPPPVSVVAVPHSVPYHVGNYGSLPHLIVWLMLPSLASGCIFDLYLEHKAFFDPPWLGTGAAYIEFILYF